MKIIYTFLLALLCPFFVLAQSNFKLGYVINLKGDTLRGVIDYKDWSLNPKSISFKNEINSTQTSNFAPKDLKAFAIDGFEYYQSYKVQISMDNITSNQLSTGLDTTSVTENVFLRVVSTGKNATLFSYNDQLKWRYFIAEANENPTELILHHYIDEKADRLVKIESYKRQLQGLAVKYQPGMSTLLATIERSDYRSTPLSSIVTKINNGTNTIKTQLVGKERAGFRFYGGIGASSYTARFLGDDYLSTIPASKSTMPKISAGVDLFFNKNVGRWLAKFDLSFITGKYSFFYDGGKTDNFTQLMKFNQSTLLFNPQLLANVYNAKQFKIYVSGGASLGINFYGGKENTFNNAGAVIDGMYYFPMFSTTTFSFTGRVGVVINKFDIYAGYSPYSNITSVSSNKSIEASLGQVGINYLFK